MFTTLMRLFQLEVVLCTHSNRCILTALADDDDDVTSANDEVKNIYIYIYIYKATTRKSSSYTKCCLHQPIERLRR
jgi:hypothetical protein